MIDPESYCRDLESYLCRKNDGHLIRIVGPAFDTVRGWAERGIPYTIACRGVDRYFERYYAKGPRRRPVRVEFCEADVLDAFDEWRRAVGVHVASASAGTEDDGGAEEGRRHGSLPAHLERLVARLTVLRAGGRRSRDFDATCDRIIAEIDAARAGAKTIRGHARQQLLDRLAVLDAELLAAARHEGSVGEVDGLRREAESELAPFRSRMASEAYEAALDAATNRLVRERLGLPELRFE